MVPLTAILAVRPRRFAPVSTQRILKTSLSASVAQRINLLYEHISDCLNLLGPLPGKTGRFFGGLIAAVW